MKKRCCLLTPGTKSYQEGLRLQEQAWQQVQQGKYDGILILLEHKPVITIGRSGGSDNLFGSEEAFKQAEIEIAYTNRGGNITCHNPGQLVGYPILDLKKWQADVHWYLRTLEEVLLATLARLGLRPGRKARYTGVWLNDAKIAAIGVAVRQWITSHGFSLNVDNDLSLFDYIVPCGIKEFGVTSLVCAGIQTDVSAVSSLLVKEFCRLFECELLPVEGGYERYD